MSGYNFNKATMIDSMFENYQGGIRNNVKSEKDAFTENFKQIQKVFADGKYLKYDLEKRANGGAGAWDYRKDYKRAASYDSAQQMVYVKDFQARGTVDKKLKLAANSAGAFEDLYAKAFTDLSKSCADMENNQIWTKEDGILGVATGAGAAVAGAKMFTVNMGQYKTMRFRPGQICDIRDAAGALIIADVIVDGDDQMSGLVTFELTDYSNDGTGTLYDGVTGGTTGTNNFGPATITTGAQIGINDAFGDQVIGGVSVGQLGMTGIEELFSETGVYHGINKDTNSWYRAHRMDAAGDILTDDKLRDIKDIVDNEVSENEAESLMFVAKTQVIRNYEDELIKNRRYSEVSYEGHLLVGGRKNKLLAFDGQPIFKTRRASHESVSCINAKFWEQPHLQDWSWDNMDGKVLKFTGGANYDFRMSKHTNLTCYNLRANAIIENLAEDRP